MRFALPMLALTLLGACAHRVHHMGPMASMPGEGIAFAGASGGSLLLATEQAQSTARSQVLCVQGAENLDMRLMSPVLETRPLIDTSLLDQNVLTFDELRMLQPELQISNLMDPVRDLQPPRDPMPDGL